MNAAKGVIMSTLHEDGTSQSKDETIESDVKDVKTNFNKLICSMHYNNCLLEWSRQCVSAIRLSDFSRVTSPSHIDY